MKGHKGRILTQQGRSNSCPSGALIECHNPTSLKFHDSLHLASAPLAELVVVREESLSVCVSGRNDDGQMG